MSADADPPRQDRPVRVLYVDDDPALSRLVQRHLSRHGYTMTLAADGHQAVALAAAGGFDVVILDQIMPGLDGLETLAALRAGAAPPPVVFVTAADDGRIAAAALTHGASDYVIKDVQGAFLDRLDGAIRQVLVQAGLRRQKEAAEQAERAARERLEREVERQAVLLREMNHRVANSLQLIASLIGLQAYSLDDAAIRDQLLATRERVHAIMHVHRRLYTSSDVEIIRLDQYLAALSEDLGAALRDRNALIRLSLDADPVTVATDKAVSVGVIVNELITNACKYAYAPHRGGEIRIRLKSATGTTAVILAVEDDGGGFAEDHPPLGSGLGRQVVQAMAKSLSATVMRDPDFQGTRIEVRFNP